MAVVKLSSLCKLLTRFLEEHEGQDFDVVSIGRICGIDVTDRFEFNLIPLGESADSAKELHVPIPCEEAENPYMKEPYEKMSYEEFANLMREHNRTADERVIEGVIVFTEDSFSRKYSEKSRSYRVSSSNKAYYSNVIGYSIFGSALDGSDPLVRLDQYMKDENGSDKGWTVDYCYILPTE